MDTGPTMRTIRIALALAFLATLAAPSHAQVYSGRWIADSAGCRFWDPQPLPNETVRWAGRCVGGYAEGHGTLTWYEKGVLYETDVADFKQGMLNGHGSLSFVTGMKFDGQFRDQKPNGFGTLKANNGEVFSGNWIEGCFNDGKRQAQYNALDGCNFAS
jgi:hypothetical protein